MEKEKKSIEIKESTGEIIITTSSGRTVITKEFQEEIYYIVCARKIREILKASPLIREATSDPQEIEEMIKFYLYRMEESNKKDAEDFCWLALVDLDLDRQRANEEEEELAFEKESLPAEFILQEPEF